MIQGFIKGFTSHLQAIEFIAKHRLWSYFLAPALISLVLGLLIFGSAWSVSDNLGGWLISFYPFEWGKAVLEKIASVFGAIFILAAGLILFKHLVMALAAPFMSPLSEKVEKIIRGNRHAPAFSLSQMLEDLIRGLRIAVRNIIRELFYTFLLFLIGLIPIFSPFVSIAIFAVQAYYAGFGNMDFTLERHFKVRDSIRFVRRHKGLALGNGSVFLLLLLLGIGFLIALPLGTVAATLETVPRLNEKEVKY